MKALTIYKDEDIGLYSIKVGGEIMYECLAADEVVEIVKDFMEGSEE